MTHPTFSLSHLPVRQAGFLTFSGKRLMVIIALLISQCAYSQHLLSDSLLVHYTQGQVNAIFTGYEIPFSSSTGMSLYRLIYSTMNAQRTDTTIASGLMVAPDAETCPLPVAMYDHGTVLQRTAVPSYDVSDPENIITMLLAASGYYALAPDYLGLGTSPGFHPYVHAESEAQAGIDLIFAAKQFAANNNIELSDQLFLTGYSQGGHACMATHRAIQQNYAGQLTVTASAPGSGPYDMSGVETANLAADTNYADPSFIPFLIFAYQDVYGNLYDSVSQFLLPPWDSILPPLFFAEQTSTDAIDNIMPHNIDSFMVAAQLQMFVNDSATDPLRIDLVNNDVYRWVPNAPIEMTYCTADETVYPQNTLVAYNYFTANGDTTALEVNGGALNHTGCVTPAVTNMLEFFSGYKITENNLVLALSTDSASSADGHDASVKISVSGGTGYTILWSTGSNDSVVTGLSNGTYTVTVTDAKGCAKVRSISTGGEITGIFSAGNVQVQFNVFPNPANNTLYLHTSGFEPVETDLLDINGREVMQDSYKSQLDISGLVAGVYIVQVKGGNAMVWARMVKL